VDTIGTLEENFSQNHEAVRECNRSLQKL
jgi:hypothetical protein